MPVPIGLLATHVTDLSKYTSSLAHGPSLFPHNLTILHAHALHAHFAHTRRLRPATRRLRRGSPPSLTGLGFDRDGGARGPRPRCTTAMYMLM